MSEAATNIVFAQIQIDSIKAFIKQEIVNKRSKSIIIGIVTPNGRQIFSEGKISDRDTGCSHPSIYHFLVVIR